MSSDSDFGILDFSITIPECISRLLPLLRGHQKLGLKHVANIWPCSRNRDSDTDLTLPSAQLGKEGDVADYESTSENSGWGADGAGNNKGLENY